jgi:hypothetical protein
MGGAVGLNGREYKLLLEPGGFSGAPADRAVTVLWKSLTAIIDEHLGKKRSGASRAEGELTRQTPRAVTFLDTEGRLLDELGLALRQRTELDEDDGEPNGAPEITLKFRSPDTLLAAKYRRVVTARQTKLEEDVAPLQVKSNGQPMAIPEKRSAYSRFAVSTKRDKEIRLKKVEHLFQPFKWLPAWLSRSADQDLARMRLHSGPAICEWIFEGGSVYLGAGVKGQFTLTLWYLRKDDSLESVYKWALSGKLNPRVAEISFDFDIKGGQLDAGAAERAAKLFIAMQALPVDRKETSKTKLALP